MLCSMRTNPPTNDKFALHYHMGLLVWKHVHGNAV